MIIYNTCSQIKLLITLTHAWGGAELGNMFIFLVGAPTAVKKYGS